MLQVYDEKPIDPERMDSVIAARKAKLNIYELVCKCDNRMEFEIEGRPTRFTLVQLVGKFGSFPLKCNQCGTDHGPDDLKKI